MFNNVYEIGTEAIRYMREYSREGRLFLLENHESARTQLLIKTGELNYIQIHIFRNGMEKRFEIIFLSGKAVFGGES